MKKFTALLGILGAVGMYTACSSDTVSGPADDNNLSGLTSSSVSAESSDDSSESSNSSSGTTNPVVKDSIVHQSVIITVTSSGSHEVPYPSDKTVFCWTDKCEKEYGNTTPQSSSSSISIQVTMSSEAQTPPTVTENKMIDQRDQKEYALARIAGLHWMTENLNYETKNGYYCSYGESGDVCATYGGFYTYGTAQRVCPEGWRLPTAAEVTALDAAVDHEWWQVGGRFKLSDGSATEYGLKEEQGYIWIQAEGEYSSFRIKNYGGDDNLHELQSGTTGERAYNVRCVSEQ